MGFCNVWDKKIGLTFPSKIILIHEICHAISVQKHGTAWKIRMRKAIEIAQEREPEIVPDLENEIARCITQTDMPNRERERLIINEVKGDANYYHDFSEALDGLLADCGIFPEYNRQLYHKIHDKAIRAIESTIRARRNSNVTE
jgi:hypothetical protein